MTKSAGGGKARGEVKVGNGLRCCRRRAVCEIGGNQGGRETERTKRDPGLDDVSR